MTPELQGRVSNPSPSHILPLPSFGGEGCPPLSVDPQVTPRTTTRVSIRVFPLQPGSPIPVSLVLPSDQE